MVNQLIHKSSIYFHERRKIARLDKAAKEWNCILKHFDKSGDAEATVTDKPTNHVLTMGPQQLQLHILFWEKYVMHEHFFKEWNTAIGYNAAFVIYFNRTIGGIGWILVKQITIIAPNYFL